MSVSNDNQELRNGGLDCSSRKRKNDGTLEMETEHAAFSTPHTKQECSADTDMSTSVKKRRKRRIDFSPENTCYHDKLNSKPTPVLATSIIPDFGSINGSSKNGSNDTESTMPKVTIECETDENITYVDTELKTVKSIVSVTPLIKPVDAAFRIRSASAGDNSTKLTTGTGLPKSAIPISPAVSVKVAPGTSPMINTTAMKSLAFSIPKSPGDSRMKTKAIVLPVAHKKYDEVNVSKMSVKDMPSRATIPLSIFKSGSVKPVKPLVLKVAGTSKRVSPTFSINILNLAKQGSPKMREKRSLSADLPHPPKLTCLKSLKSSKHTGLQQSTPITQLHIITPAVKSKPNTQTTAISLLDLQNALSSGSIAITSKLDSATGDVKVGTKEPFKKEEKMPISPSQGKETQTSKPKGKKSSNLIVKSAMELNQGNVPKFPTIKEPSPSSAKLKPIYEAIGDSISLSSDSSSVIEDLLPRIARKVPLIMEERDFLQFPFCAASESEFLDWNVGKQRASELKRAILIQDVLKYLIKNNKSLKESTLPSKKFLMDWCLKHGYSIFTDEFEEGGDESSSFENADKGSNMTSTLASPQALMKRLEVMEKSEEEDSIIVDVISVDDVSCPPQRKEQSIPQLSHIDTVDDLPKGLKTLMSSLEIKLVEEQTRRIGIQLHHQDNLPMTHMVLAKALQQFVESLLRKALSKRLTRRDGSSLQRIAPDEIFVADVVNAVSASETFDFLTDNHLASNVR